MEKAKIIFNDGTEIAVDRNSDCYIVSEEPKFPDDLSVVTVEGDDYLKVFRHAEKVECASVDGNYWFTFIEVSEDIRAMRQMEANIEYIAMMADIELDN